jgi:hypothetical protein
MVPAPQALLPSNLEFAPRCQQGCPFAKTGTPCAGWAKPNVTPVMGDPKPKGTTSSSSSLLRSSSPSSPLEPQRQSSTRPTPSAVGHGSSAGDDMRIAAESRLCGGRYRHVGGRPVLGERWGRVRRARGRPGAALGGSRARGGGYYPETDRCGVTLHPYGVTPDINQG